MVPSQSPNPASPWWPRHSIRRSRRAISIFAMAFSVFVELVNQRIRHKAPVHLKKAY